MRRRPRGQSTFAISPFGHARSALKVSRHSSEVSLTHFHQNAILRKVE
jgi:hypothetical protein